MKVSNIKIDSNIRSNIINSRYPNVGDLLKWKNGDVAYVLEIDLDKYAHVILFGNHTALRKTSIDLLFPDYEKIIRCKKDIDS